MRRHGPVIANCTDSEDFPTATARGSTATYTGHRYNAKCGRLQNTAKQSNPNPNRNRNII